jgi:outer membrane biosynthesis protein TonB
VQGPDLSPIQRLVLAFYAFFAILFQADVAAAFYRVREARRAGAPLPEPAPGTPPRVTALQSTPPAAPPPAPAAAPPAAKTAAPAPTKPVELPKPVEPLRPAEPPKGVEAPKPVAAAKPVEAPRPAEGAKVAPEAAKPAAPAVVKAPEPVRAAAAPAAAAAPDPRAALQLLAVLQREGRLVDFIEEDLSGFPDASIGAAARTVHAGCKRAIEEYFRLEPVFREPEGARVTVASGFDPAAIRLTGNVVGAAPFQGALRHHGWRAREVRLPLAKDGGDPTLVAPAEVEL